MSWATASIYNAELSVEVLNVAHRPDCVLIIFGDFRLCVSTDDAIRLREQLAATLTQISIQRDAQQVAA
jgi:hypothetical protein